MTKALLFYNTMERPLRTIEGTHDDIGLILISTNSNLDDSFEHELSELKRLEEFCKQLNVGDVVKIGEQLAVVIDLEAQPVKTFAYIAEKKHG